MIFCLFVSYYYNSCFHGVLQSGSLAVCDVDESLKEKLKKFRFRKETTNGAIISKCQIVIIETEGKIKVLTQFQLHTNSGFFFSFKVKIDMEKHLVILDQEFDVSPYVNYVYSQHSVCFFKKFYSI